MVWLNDLIFLYNNANGRFENVQSDDDNWMTGDPDLLKSNVLNFGTQVLFYEYGKRPYLLSQVVNYARMDGDTHYATDLQDRIWFYDANNGLVRVDHGDVSLVSHIPDDLKRAEIGGILVGKDNRIWVGSAGVIWAYADDNWQKYIIPETDELFTHFAEDSAGDLYGATDTSVYLFTNDKFNRYNFVVAGKKPIVLSDNGKPLDWQECTFHKRYSILGNCPGNWTSASSDYRYKARLLKIQDDGSVIYINNHVIAKFEDGGWKGFVFDTFEIGSASIDKDGNIWIFCGSEGLIRLTPDIFNDYQGLQR